jgi:hypothetical protein
VLALTVGVVAALAMQVPLEFPDEPLPDVPLDCPSCQRAVCSTCRSKWHSGLVSLRDMQLCYARGSCRSCFAASRLCIWLAASSLRRMRWCHCRRSQPRLQQDTRGTLHCQ